MVTKYSLGFLHDDDLVVLIKKNRPEWQAGKLNGVGGKVEEGESFHDAMVREFWEETGVMVPEWDHFLTLSGTQSEIQCFAQYGNYDLISQCETKTDEIVDWFEFWDLMNYNTVPNMQWIVPLMLQRGKYHPITVNFHGDS